MNFYRGFDLKGLVKKFDIKCLNKSSYRVFDCKSYRESTLHKNVNGVIYYL